MDPARRDEGYTAPGIRVLHHADGRAALRLYSQDRQAFRRRLLVQLQEAYRTPGWLVDRLWQLNPTGQGELLLPSPLPEWQPESLPRGEAQWSPDLQDQARCIWDRAREAAPGVLPTAESVWVDAVEKRWYRLACLGPRGRPAKQAPRYSPRARLAEAMREAALELFLSARAPIWMRRCYRPS